MLCKHFTYTSNRTKVIMLKYDSSLYSLLIHLRLELATEVVEKMKILCHSNRFESYIQLNNSESEHLMSS